MTIKVKNLHATPHAMTAQYIQARYGQTLLAFALELERAVLAGQAAGGVGATTETQSKTRS